MHPRHRFKADFRMLVTGGRCLALVLAAAAALAPGAQAAGVITPHAPPASQPIVPQAVTTPPAPSAPAPPPSSPPSSSTSGSIGQSSNGPAPDPNDPENEPDDPDLPEIGEGCDFDCLEGWAAYYHAWVRTFGATPLSEYNANDYVDLPLVADALVEVKDDITAALISGAHTTLTDAITESFDGSAICSHDDTPEGDVLLCPN